MKKTGTTGKTVAIIVGGTAGVGFLVICLLFVKNLMKKKYDGIIFLSTNYIHTRRRYSCTYHVYKHTCIRNSYELSFVNNVFYFFIFFK